MIIGLAGSMNAGKDTVADYLVRLYGFKKRSFADPIRKMAEAINPIVVYEIDEDDHRKHSVYRYNDVLQQVGYTKAKEMYPEVRAFLQRLGLEAGRNVLGHNIWVDTAMKGLSPEDNVVLPDVRFQNEMDAIHELGGKVALVTRPVPKSKVKDAQHGTEKFALEIQPDGIIANDSNLNNLEMATIEFYNYLRYGENESNSNEWS